LLEQKVTKIQGLIKIGCGSKPEVSSRNTRHERFEQRMKFVVAVYCYTHAYAHTSVKNHYPIFLMPILSKKAFPNEIVVEQQLCR